MQGRRKPFFFEKKNQKTFAPGACGVAVPDPVSPGAKVFCALFFKKAPLSLPCAD
jgi:hypothetical protein